MIRFQRSSRLASRPPPRDRGPRAIEQLIGRLIARYGLTDEVREQCIFTFWSEIVGAKVGAITQPDAIVNGTLRVITNSSPRLQELQFLRTRLVDQINDWVAAVRWLRPPPSPLVLDVRFTIGTVRPVISPDVRRLQLRQWRRLRPTPPPILDTDRNQICAATNLVEDADLRATIERVRLQWNC